MLGHRQPSTAYKQNGNISSPPLYWSYCHDVCCLLQANEDWLLADVHEKGVLFSHEDVQDVVMQVLGHPR